MQLRRRFFPLIAALIAPIIVLSLAVPAGAAAYPPESDALAGATVAELPDAPTPQSGSTSNSGSSSTSSGSGQSQPQPDSQQTEHDKAEQQMKAQEKQRVAGIVPSFNVSYIGDAASMSAGQKIRLAFRSQIDPYAFGIASIVAGIGEAKDDDPGFGWGPTGYFERAGAAYLDAFDGAMIGNGFLPALLHQDPRYFRMGHGTFHRRFFYALSTSFICKHDHTGKWEPNYSNVGGNIASGAISNLYYSNGTGVVHTFTDGLTVTAEGTFGGVLQEFWPDISRKLFHKDPTNGRDAEMRAADKAKKQGQQQNTQPAPNPAPGGDAKPPQQ
jgi:hypothetical protein